MFPTSIHDRDPHDQVSSAVLGVFHRNVRESGKPKKKNSLPSKHTSSNTMDRTSS